jgi:predicted dehydrogenase
MNQQTFIAAYGRRLRLAIVGGSSGIGEVHRIAARIDGLYDLVAGVFSSDAARSRSFAKDLGIVADRAYDTWQDLVSRESRRADRIDVIAVMTPNDSHFAICSAALDAGFDLICDKPLTTSLQSSVELLSKSRAADRVLAVTYCYSGYPMVRQARAMVRQGLLGQIRQVHAQYVQGWAADNTLSGWRLDPSRSGGSSILIDIATHAYHISTFVSGLQATEVAADVDHTVPGRVMDDYGGILLKYADHAHGTIWVTSAAAGAEHGLMFKIFGDRGGLEWHQETPNALLHRPKDEFARTLTRRKSNLMTTQALRVTRTEVGHPEGYLEAFANIYSDVAWHIAARRGVAVSEYDKAELPSALDGAAGLAFVEAAAASSLSKTWVRLKPVD